MTKYDFEDWLRHRLSDLPQDELDRIAAFYMDAIEGRMDDGMTEEEAIYDLGEPEALLEGIRASLPEYQTTTYRPVRESKQSTAGRRKWLTAGLTVMLSCMVLFAAFVLIINFSRPTNVYVPVPEAMEAPAIEMTYPMVSEPTADQSFDSSTLEKVTVAASFGNVQAEPSADGAVHILGDPVFYQANRRGNTLYIENAEADIILQIPYHVKLEVKCDLGSAVLYEIVPQSLNVCCDLGSITLHNVSAVHSITLEADCGNIEGTLRGPETDYIIDVEVDLGQTNLSDSYHVGGKEIKLTATADAGSVNINFEE